MEVRNIAAIDPVDSVAVNEKMWTASQFVAWLTVESPTYENWLYDGSCKQEVTSGVRIVKCVLLSGIGTLQP